MAKVIIKGNEDDCHCGKSVKITERKKLIIKKIIRKNNPK